MVNNCPEKQLKHSDGQERKTIESYKLLPGPTNDLSMQVHTSKKQLLQELVNSDP